MTNHHVVACAWGIGLFVLCAAPPLHAQRTPPPAAGGSIIDRHGPDGLPFSPDDPLRAHADVHRGVFFLSFNAVGPFAPDGTPDLSHAHGGSLELCFLDMSSMTVSRRRLFPPQPAWEPPQRLGDGRAPRDWTEGQDFFVSGGAMQHELEGDPDRPAMKFDPAWLRNLGTSENYARLADTLVDHVKLDKLEIQNSQYVTCWRAGEGLRESLATSLSVVLGTVRPVLKSGATIAFESEEQIRSASQVPAGFRDKVTADLAAHARLAGQVTADQVLSAAVEQSGDCRTAGVRDPDLCPVLQEFIDQTRRDLSTLAQSRRALQQMLDEAYHVTQRNSGSPTFGWLPWQDPQAGLVSSVVDDGARRSGAQVRFELEMQNILNPDGPGAADHTGSHVFDSGFMYGPTGRWFIANRGEPGFVENYVFARLSSVNPYDVEERDGRSRVSWKQVNLITRKPVPFDPPRVPWPPVPPAWTGPAPWWRFGTAQLIGDDAANGTWDRRDGPEQAASMLASVAPDERSDRVHLAGIVRSVDRRSGQPGSEMDWTPYEEATLSLPPGYRAAGRDARFFRIGIANRRPGARAFRYAWDLDGDLSVDTATGNTVRKIAVASRHTASCFVDDPVTGRTGLAAVVVEP